VVQSQWKLCPHLTEEQMCSDSLMWAVHGRTVAAVMLMNDSWLLHLLDVSVIVRHICKIVQMTIGFIMCVHPSICLCRTTRLPLDGFSWNLIFEHFPKICQWNSSFTTIGQEWQILYMNTNINFLSYVT
jgi:hypothetical protein